MPDLGERQPVLCYVQTNTMRAHNPHIRTHTKTQHTHNAHTRTRARAQTIDVGVAVERFSLHPTNHSLAFVLSRAAKKEKSEGKEKRSVLFACRSRSWYFFQ